MTAADHLKNMRRTYEHATTPAEDAMAPAWSTHDFMQSCAPRLLDALERVLEVHKQDDDMPLFCHACDDYWPCPTVAAINDALEGKHGCA